MPAILAAVAPARRVALVPERLVDRDPRVPTEQLLAALVPPPRFAHVRFSTYLPDPGQPTQAAAVAVLDAFGHRFDEVRPRRGLFRRSPAPPEGRSGVYLDGGFGVGKTHLLASLWHAAPAPKAFGTFVELTHLVGALGFAATTEAFAAYRLLCIDEFELDDPGDTVLMSTLLGRLVASGVRLSATSNTLPDTLGEGRFAADDFLREIQGLAAHFDVVRVDGEDYRHRGMPAAPAPWTSDDVRASAASAVDAVTLDDFAALLAHLANVHPSRYGALVDGVQRVHLLDVVPVPDQATALRVVVLADRLYDRDIPVVASGVPFDQLFDAEMLRGGYRKKYLRAVSRLVALARET
jgi:cell division protein ZapE